MTYREGIIKETEFFTTAELAKKLKMNVQVITRKVQSGEIEAYKIGKDWRIPEQSVYDWLQNQSNRQAVKLKRGAEAKGNGNSGGSRVAPSGRVQAHVRKESAGKTSKRQFLLEYILAQFEPGRDYSEKEVNRIISRYHSDHDAIRDEFIDKRMMELVDGSFRRRAGYVLTE